MASRSGNLRALAICYRLLGGFLGALVALLCIVEFSHSPLYGLSGFLRLGPTLLLGLPWLAIAVGAALVLALFEVASSLENGEHRVFCLVMAWLVCASFPLGTVLGVCTILQLNRPELAQPSEERAETWAGTTGRND